MFDLPTFLGGEHRVVISYLTALPVFGIPAFLLLWLTTIPLNKLPPALKQLIAIPLLAIEFLIPFGYTVENRIVTLGTTAVNFTLVLRFLEIFFTAPAIQGRPPHSTVKALFEEFFTCLRDFPRPAKADNEKKGIKKGDVKVYVKDKKFYHVILYIVLNLVVLDVVGGVFGTFTGEDISICWNEKSITYLAVFLMSTTLLTCGFNMLGYIMHLVYCIIFEGGSYSSEQYRSLMKNPLLANSLDDLWSNRWHGLFKTTWLALPFRPVFILSERLLSKSVKGAKDISYMLANLSVFGASSLMHEYMIASSMGLYLYKQIYMGEQCKFFMAHGAGVILEKLFRATVLPHLPKKFTDSTVCSILQHIWGFFFSYFTFYYIEHGFSMWGFHMDIPFTVLSPYVLDVIRANPALQQFAGSRLFSV